MYDNCDLDYQRTLRSLLAKPVGDLVFFMACGELTTAALKKAYILHKGGASVALLVPDTYRENQFYIEHMKGMKPFHRACGVKPPKGESGLSLMLLMGVEHS